MTNDTITAAEPIALPAGATLHPLVLPARAGAAPTALLREYSAVRNASILETTGRDDDALSAEELLPVLYSSTDNTKHQWYIAQDGAIIGCAAVDIMLDGDADTAILVIALLRRTWGQGIGTAALAHLESLLRAKGVRKILGWVEHHADAPDAGVLPSPTGFGSIPLDHTALFLQRRGYALEQIERASTLEWGPDTVAHLRGLLADAEKKAEGYRIVQWMRPTPPELIDGYAWMKSRMSTDVPDAELDLPEEIWDAARVAEQEERSAARGSAIQVTAAQHIATGELCAFNELAIRAADPADTSHQYDTLVLREHRGRRLGMLVKCAGLLGWHERFPDSPRVLTYNAEENRPMLDINEALGFVPIAYEGAWKKTLS